MRAPSRHLPPRLIGLIQLRACSEWPGGQRLLLLLLCVCDSASVSGARKKEEADGEAWRRETRGEWPEKRTLSFRGMALALVGLALEQEKLRSAILMSLWPAAAENSPLVQLFR